MDKIEILSKLEELKPTLRKDFLVKKIGLFGSYARGEETENSDIDIVVELAKPDLFILGDIKMDLEELFLKDVDIVRLRSGMNKVLVKRLEKEVIYV